MARPDGPHRRTRLESLRRRPTVPEPPHGQRPAAVDLAARGPRRGAYGRLCEHLDSGRESTLFKFHLYRECRYLCDGGRGGPAVHGEEAIKIRCVIDNGIVRHRGLALGRLCRMCIKERNASRAACPQPTSDRIVGCPALGRFVKRLVRLEDAMAKVVDG